MEPGHGLHPDIARVRALLRDALRQPVQGRTRTSHTSVGSTCSCVRSVCVNRWNGTKPRRIFVNSMSDLFHEDVPEAYIRQVFDVMEEAEQHTFQVLTKRAERARQLAPDLPWPSNVWLGVSVENKYWTRRIDDAARGARRRALPLLRAAARPAQ